MTLGSASQLPSDSAAVSDILNRVLPILLLLAAGAWMRRVRFISETTVADLRKIVVNFALPAVLFTAFLEVERRYVNNVLSLYTLGSIGLFIGYLTLNPI